MSFTNDNDLELQAEGGSDWDNPLRANFAILERGVHIRATAASAINSGQICRINSAGQVVPYDSRSLSLRWPHLMSYKSVNSGESAIFIRDGIVRSMAVWSGKIVPGEPVFVAPNSVGFAVSSFPAAAFPAGIALGPDSIWFRPGITQMPELTTEVQTLSNVVLGTAANFAMSLGNRGIARRVQVMAQSANAFRVEFWSGSQRVSSEMLYATQTRSHARGDSVDITSIGFWDQAGFPWFNTDTASPALVFGRITVQSGSECSSSHFAVTVVLERFR